MALSVVLGGPDVVAQSLTMIDPGSLEALYQAPRPSWVRANLIVSLDGAVELEGRSSQLGGPDDRLVFSALRALADVVLVGSGTARTENYGPVTLPAAARSRRIERGQSPRPPVAVLTNRADLDPQGRLFTEAVDDPVPLILTCDKAPIDARSALAKRADVVICGDESVDLTVALDQLRARALTGVLCEGGPTVVTSLLAAGAIDELCLTQAPVLAGPGHLGLVAGAPLADPVRAHLVHLLVGDGLLFNRYHLPSRGVDRR
ncbi:MAG: pyrimidine reductase family protein [Actinomycetota bacterium]|nr:pyrimidine reductase family protein [Actinomycetota bacterium]